MILPLRPSRPSRPVTAGALQRNAWPAAGPGPGLVTDSKRSFVIGFGSEDRLGGHSGSEAKICVVQVSIHCRTQRPSGARHRDWPAWPTGRRLGWHPGKISRGPSSSSDSLTVLNAYLCIYNTFMYLLKKNIYAYLVLHI